MTIGSLLTLLLLIALIRGGWLAIAAVQRRRRGRPRPIDELRATVQARRESLRRAAATEYRHRTRTGRES